ncbi:FUSC family protein [Streptosporangiaceae bacterium NEAU-GS5]|nr:FUSC family protein [Streptosporangiaceae bacterium NEAU-GS5]
MVAPLVVGAVTGHPLGGGTVALGAWLVATRANADPAGTRLPYMLGATLALACGVLLGIALSGHGLLMVPVAALLGGIGVLVPFTGPTAALTLLLTVANPLPIDPLPHLGLQLLGGLISSVTLTLPWPWRETRPLPTTLAEAAAALADLVAATDGPAEEWDARRHVASARLTEARTAVARYRWQRRSTAAESLTAALRRVLYEAVALRSLNEALTKRAPDVKVGMPELIGSLEAGVRAFADVLTGAPVTIREPPDFARRVDALRGQAPDGERELLVLVVLRQIGHCADRIRETLTAVAEPLLEVATPGWSPLRLASMPRAPRWSLDDPHVRHALRVGLGTGIASAIIAVYPLQHAQWLAISVLLTIQPTYGETFARVWARILGSTIGAVAAALVLFAHPSYGLLALGVWVSAVAAFTLVAAHYTYWATFMTACILLLIDFQIPQDPGVAGARILLTIIGCLISLVCTRLLWPRGEVVRLGARVARMLAAHGAAARTVAQLSRGRPDGAKTEDRMAAAARAAEAVSGALGVIPHEPGGAAPEGMREVVEAAERVRDDLITVAAVLREDPGDVGPAPKVLDAVADRLEGCADAVRAREPYRSSGDVDTALADLGAWLGDLADRRMDELELEPSDSRTEVRRALLHAAAADHALRSLGRDSSRLCKIATAQCE